MFYKKIVINMKTMLEVEVWPDFPYDPELPIALCKGGSGGGGGGSGRVDYPDYMKTFHGEMLDDSTSDTLDYSIVDHLNAAHGSNPFTGTPAYDPISRITDYMAEIGTFDTLVTSGIASGTAWQGFLANVVDATSGLKAKFEAPTPAAEDEIAADVDAYQDIVDDHVETDILPRFQRGMQDINAVQSSAFVIGQAIIEGMANRDVAKYQGNLRVAAFLQKDKIDANSLMLKNQLYTQSIGQIIQYYTAEINANLALTNAYIEGNRIAIVAEKEQADRQVEIDEFEALWDLESWATAGNALAAIGSASVQYPSKGMSKGQSALSGALAGAAVSTMVGAGPLVGAGIGLAAGLFL